MLNCLSVGPTQLLLCYYLVSPLHWRRNFRICFAKQHNCSLHWQIIRLHTIHSCSTITLPPLYHVEQMKKSSITVSTRYTTTIVCMIICKQNSTVKESLALYDPPTTSISRLFLVLRKIGQFAQITLQTDATRWLEQCVLLLNNILPS